MNTSILYMKSQFYFFTILICLCSVSVFGQKKLPEPNNLTVSEGFKNPLGFYNSTPTFSWQLPVAKKVLAQYAYQIRVASSKTLLTTVPDFWDTGKIVSSQSNWVKYAGKKLGSRQKVYWQIRYWSQDKKASNWSAINTIELGLLHNKDWQAKWTGLDTAKDSIKGVRNFLMHRPQYLRKQFNLKSNIASARLYVTAKGIFDVYINGKDISNDVLSPGWTPYDKRIETLTYDVTNFLIPSKNTIGVQLASGWHSGRISRGKALYENFASPKVLCQLEIKFKDGSTQTVLSDQSWKGTTNGPIRLAGLYDGVTYNANLEMPNWSTNNFNDASWVNTETTNLVSTVKLEPKRHNTVKETAVLDDVEIVSATKKAVIFNLKQNMLGVPQVHVPMKKGDTLKIRFSEMLLDDGTFYTKNYRSAKSTDYYIASKDGYINWKPKFTFHGFQFVELSGFDSAVLPKNDWVKGIVQHTNFDKNGTFVSSHKKLNKLQSNITWGLRDNFLDIPTDCPQRDERLGWTGDAQVITPTVMFNYNTHSFLAAWLQSMRETQLEHKDGLIPFIIPDVLQRNKASSGWGDVCVIMPWDLYNATGDVTVLEENYDMMKKWIAYHQTQAKQNISTMFSFADWLQPYPQKTGKAGKRGDTPNRLINTAYFAYSSHLVSQVAGVLGAIEDQKKYKKLYLDISTSFEKEFFNTDGSVKKNKGTQTGYLLSIYFKLLKPETQQKAEQWLLKEIKKADNHLRTGFLGTPILNKVLDNMGEIDLAYSLLFKETYPSWFYSINQGATTTWERWNSFSKKSGYNKGSMNSLNHYAYGAIGQWLYERIAGISMLKPGYKKIKIAPQLNSRLTHASGSVKTPYGLVSSSWKVKNKLFYLEVVIPPNTTAQVTLPIYNKDKIVVNGKRFKTCSKTKFIKKTKTTFTVLLQPGRYKLQSNYK